LDWYIRTQASQDLRRRAATCFVAVEDGSNAVAGFYTLAAASLVLADLPEDQTKKLPRYTAIPGRSSTAWSLPLASRAATATIGCEAARWAERIERQPVQIGLGFRAMMLAPSPAAPACYPKPPSGRTAQRCFHW
jgi:hypothetical protein